MEHFSIFGYTLNTLSLAELVDQIALVLEKPKLAYLVTLNPEMIVQAQQSLWLKQHLATADLCVADGIGLVVAACLIKRRCLQRITGLSLITSLLKKNKFSFYLVGATEAVVQATAEKINQSLDIAQSAAFQKPVVGWHNGYFLAASVEEENIIQDIIHKKPDIILVGMGCPQQDAFIAKLAQRHNYGCAIGVGGSFDILSGAKKRAPLFWQRLGLEWVYRSCEEPQRLKRWGFIPRYLLLCIQLACSGARRRA